MAETKGYPATLNIDYPEESDRLTVVFRLLVALPVLIIWALLFGRSNGPGSAENGTTVVYYGVGLVIVPTMLMILFRKKYPKWWFDWNLELSRFTARVFAYLLFLRDEYPSTDEEQAIHLEIQYPDAATELKRGMPLVKWFLALPHFIVLEFLNAAVVFVSIVAWFAILITGRYPRSLFDFVVGVMRWGLRVAAYAILLTTDEYPPFSLSE
jgi:hypothetical protein